MFEPHPLARVLPVMSGEDYARLRDDIAAAGLIDPITLYEGKVLDGVHRQKVCGELGVEPHYEPFTGTDPIRFVFAKNIARRHLNPGQLAVCAADLTSLSRKHGGDRKSQASKSSSDLNLTVREAAKVTGTSEGSIANARRVMRERPDLIKDVKSGKKTLNAAFEETAGRRNGGNNPRRPRNWNGKTNPTRQRELRAERKNGHRDNYNELLKLSLDMNRACSLIESYLPLLGDFDIEPTSLDLIDTFHDDLITLAEWVDRALLQTQTWLGDVKVRRKIAALRNTTGRGPEEAASFRALADKLEAKLAALLPSGV
jgi:hypothetical protein